MDLSRRLRSCRLSPRQVAQSPLSFAQGLVSFAQSAFGLVDPGKGRSVCRVRCEHGSGVVGGSHGFTALALAALTTASK